MSVQKWLLTVIILSILLVACNSMPSNRSEVNPPETTPNTTQKSPEPSRTPAPTNTDEPEEWTYVVMGDSSTWGFSKYYAEYIEADLGVKVTVLSRSVNMLSSTRLLEMLQEDEELRNEIKDATIIVYMGNPTHHIGWRIIQGQGDYDCSDEALESYKADLEGIISEIFALREDAPTIIRAMNYYNPLLSRWEAREDGMYDEYRRCWDALNDTIRQAADESGIPVANVYDAFNGIDHDEDPVEKGYILSDGQHTNETGQRIIAEVFRDLGYEFIIP